METSNSIDWIQVLKQAIAAWGKDLNRRLCVGEICQSLRFGITLIAVNYPDIRSPENQQRIIDAVVSLFDRDDINDIDDFRTFISDEVFGRSLLTR